MGRPKTTLSHGGARPGSGRKKLSPTGERRRTRQLSLTNAELDAVKDLLTRMRQAVNQEDE